MSDKNNVGKQFRDLMAFRGLTAEQLAEKADVPLLAVMMWENGPLTIDLLQRLLGALEAVLHVLPEKTLFTLDK